MTDELAREVLEGMLRAARADLLRLEVEVEAAEANLAIPDLPDEVRAAWEADDRSRRLAAEAVRNRIAVIERRLAGPSAAPPARGGT
jgi:hypothetical protein